MPAEKEVSLKLSAKLAGGAEDSLRKIGRTTRDAADEEEKYQRLLRGRMEAYRTAARLKEDLAKASLGEELSAEERYQQALRKRLEAYAQAKRMKADLGKLGMEDAGRGGAGSMPGMRGLMGMGMASLPLAALLGSMKGLETYRGSFSSEAGFESGRLDRGLANGLFSIPGLGFVGRMAHESDDMFRGERNIKQAEYALELQRRRLGVREPFLQQGMGLRQQAAGVQAQLDFGATSQGAQAEIAQHTTAATLTAQALAGGTLGYDRAAEQGDIARSFGAAGQLAGHDVEAQRQRQVLDAQRAAGEKEVSQAQERVEAARKAQAAAEREVEAAKGRPGRASASRKGAYLLGAGGAYDAAFGKEDGSSEELQEKRLQLERSMLETQQAEKLLQEARASSLQTEQQLQQTLLQQGQQRLAIFQSERQAVVGIIQAERQRLQASKEAFGLARPLERRAALAVARKIAGGQQLTGQELEFAKAHGDLFGASLKQIGARNAGPEYQEIVRLLGLDARQKANEQQLIKLDQAIRVQVEMNAQSVAGQLQEQILPKVYQAMAQVQQQLMDAINRTANQQRLERGAAQN